MGCESSFLPQRFAAHCKSLPNCKGICCFAAQIRRGKRFNQRFLNIFMRDIKSLLQVDMLAAIRVLEGCQLRMLFLFRGIVLVGRALVCLLSPDLVSYGSPFLSVVIALLAEVIHTLRRF